VAMRMAPPSRSSSRWIAVSAVLRSMAARLMLRLPAGRPEGCAGWASAGRPPGR
jgi:hypothetical protein